jgi:hypothetical protein
MYGIPGPLFAFMVIMATAVAILGFLVLDTRRLDARIRRRREQAEAAHRAQ